MSTMRRHFQEAPHIVSQRAHSLGLGALPMRRARQSRKKIQPQTTPTDCLIRTLVHNCKSPSELLELHYWSKEPGLLEIIRGIAAMPDQARGAIETFIALARESKSVEASLDGGGVLRLSSSSAARSAALAQCAAEDELPRVLN